MCVCGCFGFILEPRCKCETKQQRGKKQIGIFFYYKINYLTWPSVKGLALIFPY